MVLLRSSSFCGGKLHLKWGNTQTGSVYLKDCWRAGDEAGEIPSNSTVGGLGEGSEALVTEDVATPDGHGALGASEKMGVESTDKLLVEKTIRSLIDVLIGLMWRKPCLKVWNVVNFALKSTRKRDKIFWIFLKKLDKSFFYVRMSHSIPFPECPYNLQNKSFIGLIGWLIGSWRGIRGGRRRELFGAEGPNGVWQLDHRSTNHWKVWDGLIQSPNRIPHRKERWTYP